MVEIIGSTEAFFPTGRAFFHLHREDTGAQRKAKTWISRITHMTLTEKHIALAEARAVFEFPAKQQLWSKSDWRGTQWALQKQGAAVFCRFME